MDIQLNGDARTIKEGLTAEALVAELGLTGKRLAMEINQEILPRSEYETYRFQPDDKVEIVHAIGGG